MKIYIAGCGRSGTTLLLRLFKRSFEDVQVILKESPFTVIDEVTAEKPHLVVKRNSVAWRTLPELPADVHLIYNVRHPFDVLTSFHPKAKQRREYYISQERWLNEYAALRALLERQPARVVTFVRYEDLTGRPDAVQQEIVAHTGVTPARRFSEADRIHGRSVAKWERNDAMRGYLFSLPPAFRREVRAFCAQFGYDLPAEFTGDEAHA